MEYEIKLKEFEVKSLWADPSLLTAPQTDGRLFGLLVHTWMYRVVPKSNNNHLFWLYLVEFSLCFPPFPLPSLPPLSFCLFVWLWLWNVHGLHFFMPWSSWIPLLSCGPPLLWNVNFLCLLKSVRLPPYFFSCRHPSYLLHPTFLYSFFLFIHVLEFHSILADGGMP